MHPLLPASSTPIPSAAGWTPTWKADTDLHPEHSCLNEIHLRGNPEDCLLLLASMLRDMNSADCNRWLTLIDPPAWIARDWLRRNRLNCERIIRLQPRQRAQAQDLTLHALLLGRSHTVVSWLNLDDGVRERLESAAQQGNARLVNICLG